MSSNLGAKVATETSIGIKVIRADGRVIDLGQVTNSQWGFWRRLKEKRRMKKLLGKENVEIGKRIKREQKQRKKLKEELTNG
jgi:hypothetical protein